MFNHEHETFALDNFNPTLNIETNILHWELWYLILGTIKASQTVTIMNTGTLKQRQSSKYLDHDCGGILYIKEVIKYTVHNIYCI